MPHTIITNSQMVTAITLKLLTLSLAVVGQMPPTP